MCPKIGKMIRLVLYINKHRIKPRGNTTIWCIIVPWMKPNNSVDNKIKPIYFNHDGAKSCLNNKRPNKRYLNTNSSAIGATNKINNNVQINDGESLKDEV